MRTATRDELPQEAEFMADLWTYIKAVWYADRSEEYATQLHDVTQKLMEKYGDNQLANVIIFGTGHNADGGLMRFFSEKANGRMS